MQDDKDGKKERRALDARPPKDFQYEEAERRATYTGDAHVNGPQGDMTAAKIELYLKPSGDEARARRSLRGRDAPRAEPQDDRRRG